MPVQLDTMDGSRGFVGRIRLQLRFAMIRRMKMRAG